jgi:hypothetical protein
MAGPVPSSLLAKRQQKAHHLPCNCMSLLRPHLVLRIRHAAAASTALAPVRPRDYLALVTSWVTRDVVVKRGGVGNPGSNTALHSK